MAMPDGPLIRSIGRWTLAGLVLNTVIGSGVYGLPSVVSATLGPQAWIGWIIAAVLIGVIVACFAEVASRFGRQGGQYLYAREAFGPFLGLQMGWVTYLVRLTSVAANINLLTIYLGEFFPAAATGGGRVAVSAGYLGVIALLNIRGIRQASWASNVLIVVKLVPLILFGAVGLGLAVGQGPVSPAAVASPTALTWLQAVMVLIYAFAGFESAVLPLGEARDPGRDAPFALFFGLAGCLLIFTAVQLVTTFALVDPGAHPRPLADAARALIGPAGATFMTLGAVLSLAGWGLSTMILVPRLTYAMAEHGDLPAAFAWVHPRYRTPVVSILAYTVLAFVLSLSGGFVQNVTISVISRLFTYALVCLALPVFRRRDGRDPTLPPARFRLPAGNLLAALGVVITIALGARMSPREAVIMAVVVGAGTVAYFVRRAVRPA